MVHGLSTGTQEGGETFCVIRVCDEHVKNIFRLVEW